MRYLPIASAESAAQHGSSASYRLMIQTLAPLLLDWSEPLQGRSVLLLGCAEAGLARLFGSRGSGHVLAIDRSAEAVESARTNPESNGCNVEFVHGDPTQLDDQPSGSHDVVVAALTLDALSRDTTQRVLQQAMRVLRVGGRLVLATTHPSRPFVRDVPRAAWPNASAIGYGSARGHMLFGRVAPFDDSSLSIPYVHKSIEDYFGILAEIGVTTLPELREIVVTPELIAANREPLELHRDHPLFLVVRARKPNAVES